MRQFGKRPARSIQIVALALIAGTLVPVTRAQDDTPTLQSAQALLEQGRVVEAKSMLISLRKASSTPADLARTVDLLAAADRRIRFLGEVELSLQKAELALKQGELRVAETHAAAARRSDKSTPEQKQRADAVVRQAGELRDQLAPMVAPTLAQAISDFTNEKYADAKAGFASILRTGAQLTQDQTSEINRYQDRIYELERRQGRSFETDYIPLAVMRHAAPAAATVEAAVLGAASNLDDQGESGWGDQSRPQPGDDLLTETLRVDAERLMVEAEAAFQNGRYNEAIDSYTKALAIYASQLSPEQKEMAADRIAEARALIGAAAPGTLNTVIEQKRIAREESEAVFANLMSQADAALARGDTVSARNLAAQARLTWNNAQANGLFSEEQFRRGIAQVDALITRIDTTAEGLIRADIESQQKIRREDEAKTRVQQERERRQRINENLDRIRALQAEQKYEEALQVVDQVLFLDPTDPAALLMKDILRDVKLYREYEEARRARGLSYAAEFNEMQRSLVIPGELMSYPPDWPEISFRRGDLQSYVESEADRKVLAVLETRRIPASFRDNTLEDVLTYIGAVTNLNMDVDWDSLAQIGIDRDKEITLELREIPARVVLERILEKAQPDAFSKAGWAVNDGVLIVASHDMLKRNKFIVIYDIRDLLFQIPDYEEAPQLDLDQLLNQGGRGGGGGGGSPFGNVSDPERIGPTPEELLERILEIIRNNVDGDWVDLGGDTGVIQELNGNLIITNTARTHRVIQGLLNQLREIRSVQINVESRFLSVASEFFEQIAFDLDVYFNAENNQFRSVNRQLSAFGVGTLANEGNAVYPSDLVGPRFQQTQAWVVTGINPATGTPTYAFQPQSYLVPTPSSLSVVPVTQNSAAGVNTLTQAAGGLATALLGPGGSGPALGVAATYFMDDIQVDLLLEATQADQRSVSLSAPRLTFSNGRAANILVGTQQSYVSDLTPVQGNASAAFDPTVTALTTGVTLGVRGVASADRRYVTMTVEATVGSLIGFDTVTFSGAAGGQGDAAGGATAIGTFQLPTISITRVNTGVTVPDRGTILLGGQRLSREVEIEVGVPVLSKLPIINRFFTNRSTIKEENTLLLLLKPTIIIQNEEEEKAFPGLLDRLNDPFR